MDQRDKLPVATLKDRQNAAEIWNREKPWFTKVNSRWATGLRTEPKQIDVYWDWEWYRQFTFMLDATFFTNESSGLAKHQGERVFKFKHIHHKPEHAKPTKSIRQACKLMVYTVIHPHLGVIVGPDFMYTGSSPTNSKWEKDQRARHLEGFEHWYAYMHTYSLCDYLT